MERREKINFINLTNIEKCIKIILFYFQRIVKVNFCDYDFISTNSHEGKRVNAPEYA